MKKRRKAVIFDMDGVLVDSEELWKRAEYEVFTSLGVKISDELCCLTQSMTTAEVTAFWFQRYPWQKPGLVEAESRVVSKVIELIEAEQCGIQGVKAFIEKLRYQQFKIGLATNSPERIIPFVLNKLGVSHLFDAICSADNVSKGKPNPEIYLLAAKKLNLPPGSCIAIEDSLTGIVAAKNTGMTTVAFTNGNKNLDFEIADWVIDQFDSRENSFLC